MEQLQNLTFKAVIFRSLIIGDPLMPEFLLEIIGESVLKTHLMLERTFINLFIGKYIQNTIYYLRPYPFNFVLYDIRL